MTGTDKIVERIKEDSGRQCAGILAQAARQAEEITAAASAEAEKINALAAEKAHLHAQQSAAAAQSAARQKAGLLLLEAKAQAVNDTLSAVSKALQELPAEKYFGALIALAAENAMPGEGVMRLSRRDLERLPPRFEDQINEALAAGNARVAVSTQPAGIDGGFILVYGHIEVNCTFDALMQAKLDYLKETVCGIIF